MWQAKFFEALPKIVDEYPTSQFVFLSLGTHKCHKTDLRTQLTWMNQSWHKLVKRKDWPAQGWLRYVELYRRPNDFVSPIFRCLMLVPSSYFGKKYVSEERWSELWKDCLNVDYNPVVSTQPIRTPNKTLPLNGIEMLGGEMPGGLWVDGRPTLRSPRGTGKEGLINSVKYVLEVVGISMRFFLDEDLNNSETSLITNKAEVRQMSNEEWLAELTKDLKNTKGATTGGSFRKHMKVLEKKSNLIHSKESQEFEKSTNVKKYIFGWRETLKFTL